MEPAVQLALAILQAAPTAYAAIAQARLVASATEQAQIDAIVDAAKAAALAHVSVTVDHLQDAAKD